MDVPPGVSTHGHSSTGPGALPPPRRIPGGVRPTPTRAALTPLLVARSPYLAPGPTTLPHAHPALPAPALPPSPAPPPPPAPSAAVAMSAPPPSKEISTAVPSGSAAPSAVFSLSRRSSTDGSLSRYGRGGGDVEALPPPSPGMRAPPSFVPASPSMPALPPSLGTLPPALGSLQHALSLPTHVAAIAVPISSPSTPGRSQRGLGTPRSIVAPPPGLLNGGGGVLPKTQRWGEEGGPTSELMAKLARRRKINLEEASAREA
ncbi:hypothetical protein T484DRAFT_1877355 [Baffinella frigidus]|nr:hypothetical protein T484DRAFT_1877355 [Cryptophyta sp. CCMP2293]